MGKRKETKPELKEYGINADSHWTGDVMKAAKRSGFIIQAYGGMATLATHRNQLEQLGEREYLRIQRMNGHCPKTFGYEGCLDEENNVRECRGCELLGKKDARPRTLIEMPMLDQIYKGMAAVYYGFDDEQLKALLHECKQVTPLNCQWYAYGLAKYMDIERNTEAVLANKEKGQYSNRPGGIE